METELMKEMITRAGGDASTLPDNLITTHWKRFGETLGVDMSNLPDNLVTTHMQAIIDGYTGGGGESGAFSNGKGWTQSKSVSGAFYDVCYSNGMYVASGESGLWYSTDGKEWTQSNITSGNRNYMYITGSDDIWIASTNSNSGLWYSLDGKAWIQSNLKSVRFYNKPIKFKGTWVASVCDSSFKHKLYYSTDGKEWTMVHNNDSYSMGLFSADSNLCIATSATGLLYSTDGKEWTQSNATCGTLETIKFADGMWIATSKSKGGTGLESGIWYSTDGKEWTQSNITSGYGWGNVVFKFKNVWLVGLYGSGLWYSTDGKEWTQSNITDKSCSAWVKDNVAVVAVTNGMYYSIDGKEWQDVQKDKTATVSLSAKSAALINGMYIVYGMYGKILYSSDGIFWSEAAIFADSLETSSTCGFLSLVSGHNALVAAHNSSGLFYSEF